MSFALRPAKWFYNEFGLAAIHETGWNAYLIITARACRMFAHGANSLMLALFFSELNFSDQRIGLFLTLTLVGDVILGGFLTLIADRSGRRRVLIGGSFLMVMSGTVFALFENFWILLIAAVLGVISATGGDFGPFRSIEESILSHLTTPKTRADVLAWYVTTSTLGSALGSEVTGRVVHYLQGKDGWTLVDAYHTLFYLYTAMGFINAGLTMLLTDACELSEPNNNTYTQVPQTEGPDTIAVEEDEDGPPMPSLVPPTLPKKPWHKRFLTNIGGRFSQISAPTRSIMYKLWLLLAADSIADGMVPYSLTNYYLDLKFSPSKSTLGDINSFAYLLGAIGTVFAGPMARKIGLVNTMVYTHIPSSASVLIFPLPPNLVLTVLLLFVRAGLNNMDQAPRSALIAGVVRPDERTAAMGITSMVRTLAAMTGPTITGILAGNDSFWIAFVAAGACRLAYDIGLYVIFVNVKLYQHEGGSAVPQAPPAAPRLSDEEDMTELDDFGGANGKEESSTKSETPESSEDSRNARLSPHAPTSVRRRSPSPLAKGL